MAAEVQKKDGSEKNGAAKPVQPMSPAKRKQLQTQFEKGNALSAKGEFDYANDMFTYCVGGDPGNLIYTKNFLNNLMKKYNNNKKGAKLAGLSVGRASAKTALKTRRGKKDWAGVIKAGLNCLKYNPWDVAALSDVAAACAELDHDDCRLEYLKVALAVDPNDVEVNKLAALAFEDNALFDSAIGCWERIAQLRPSNDVARRMVGELHVQKTIHKGGYEGAESSIDVSVEKKAAELRKGDEEVSPEVKLRREIRRKPEDVTSYIALAEHFWKQENFEASEKVMQEAIDATGSIRAREHLEDLQLDRARRALVLAERKAATDNTEKSTALYKQMKVELNKRELEVYSGRCERYPGNFLLKYEFGLRLLRSGQFKEAITQLQEARNEPKKVAAANLDLGMCFYYLKKYDLALSSFQVAIQSCGMFDDEIKKQALYRAGKLARGMKDYETAMKCFTQLAGLEYGYKDVAELLDETTRLREQGNGEQPAG